MKAFNEESGSKSGFFKIYVLFILRLPLFYLKSYLFFLHWDNWIR